MSCQHRRSVEGFVAARLADDARRALEAHLPACATCREEVARLKALRGLLSSYQPYEPTDLDWQRLDRAVLSAMEAARAPRESWLRSLWFPSFSLAAAAAVLFFVVRPAPIPSPLAIVVPVDQVGALAMTAQPDVEIQNVSGLSRDVASRLLEEGDRLSVGKTAFTVQTAPATGVRLAPGSQVQLERLAARETTLQLLSGEIFAEVKPLSPGATFQVRTGDLLIAVRGTALRVVRGEHRTLVEVTHGLVSVEREGGGEVLLPAPSQVAIEDGAALTQQSVVRAVSAEAEAGFPLSLPDRPLLELSREAAPAVAGPVVAAAEPRPAAAISEPRHLQAGPSPRALAMRDAMLGCVRAHQRELSSCYERAQKLDPNLSGELTLSVSVDGTGAVKNVTADHTTSGFLGCAQDVVRRCEQAYAGEDVELEIPLRLSPR